MYEIILQKIPSSNFKNFPYITDLFVSFLIDYYKVHSVFLRILYRLKKYSHWFFRYRLNPRPSVFLINI